MVCMHAKFHRWRACMQYSQTKAMHANSITSTLTSSTPSLPPVTTTPFRNLSRRHHHHHPHAPSSTPTRAHLQLHHHLSLSSPNPPRIMRTIMARTPHDLSFSFPRRHLKWVLRTKPNASPDDPIPPPPDQSTTTVAKKQKQQQTMPRLRAALLAALRRPTSSSPSRPTLGSRVLGTLFGHRRGHVHLAFQVDPKCPPVLLLELAAPTGSLVREMASGLVRVALECEKNRKKEEENPKGKAATTSSTLLEEPLWRAYCNGRKWGYAVRRECGDRERGVLRAVEPVTMGAGVLPVSVSGGSPSEEGEMMYMRARFERVVGSRDSEAFYMMSPEATTKASSAGPELSIYLLRL